MAPQSCPYETVNLINKCCVYSDCSTDWPFSHLSLLLLALPYFLRHNIVIRPVNNPTMASQYLREKKEFHISYFKSKARCLHLSSLAIFLRSIYPYACKLYLDNLILLRFFFWTTLFAKSMWKVCGQIIWMTCMLWPRLWLYEEQTFKQLPVIHHKLVLYGLKTECFWSTIEKMLHSIQRIIQEPSFISKKP